MTVPKVCIALATYNGARYLRPLLDSLLAQDYSNFEVVVRDDASSDETVAILDERARTDSRINVHRGETNVGFVENFAKTIALCDGNYVALADQDDVWEPHKLSALVQRLESSGGLMICSDATLIDTQGAALPGSLWETLGVKPMQSELQEALYMRNRVTGCTCLVSRELLDLALPIPDRFPYHDWWLAYVAASQDRLRFHEERLVGYRQHDSNVIGAGRKRSKRGWLRRKLDRQEKILRSDAETRRVMDAFLAFETNGDGPSVTLQRLSSWSAARNRDLDLSEFADFFRTTTGLWALETDPDARVRGALKSLVRERYVAWVELFGPLAVALGLVLFTAKVLLG